MKHIQTHLSAQDISLALQAAGLHPYVKDLNIYGIDNEGNEYEVFTERFPEIHIRKQVPTETYAFEEHPLVLACAMNQVNALDSPVRVWADYEKVTFTLCIEPASLESFLAGIPRWLACLEQAANQLGQACEILLRDEPDDLEVITKQHPGQPY